MSTKPHLVLNWLFDIPNQRLSCKITDDLEYVATDGGRGPYTKIFKGVESTIDPFAWDHEKHWISENYGELVGYFQPDPTREIPHPVTGHWQRCTNGLSEDGRYIDHMQRLQVLLEGEDMATVWRIPGPTVADKPLFSTPDRGITIYKRATTQNVKYPEVETDPDVYWFNHPQPCFQQPYSIGYELSSYEELKQYGAPDDIIKKCQAGEWYAPSHPELQRWYIYPTA